MNDRSQRIVYEKKLFAFIDILGFEPLVMESIDNPTKIWDIYSLLNDSRQLTQRLEQAELKVFEINPELYNRHMFSDTITMSCPYDSRDYFIVMATWVVIYQYYMWLRSGTFVRGAITYDGLYEESDLLFGPAIIGAYHLEHDKDKARWPRVVVDQLVLDARPDDIGESDFEELLRRDSDGLIFLDYLNALFGLFARVEMSSIKTELPSPEELLNTHKARILWTIDCLRDNDPAKLELVSDKYRALIDYHNQVIDEQRKIITQLRENRAPIAVRDYIGSFAKEYYAAKETSGTPYVSPFRRDPDKHRRTKEILSLAIFRASLISRSEEPTNEDELTDAFCNDVPTYLLEMDRLLLQYQISISFAK